MGGRLNLLGVGAVAWLLTAGVRESARVNSVIVAIKLLVIAVFLAFGVGHIHPANWHPFLPPNTGQFGSFGLSGVLRGAGGVVLRLCGV